MRIVLSVVFVVLYFVMHSCFGHIIYFKRIPNGAFVPNPCPGNDNNWAGVGHTHTLGAGRRNLFGLDFAASGHVWTADLCNADSDGDGVSNGEELGDKNCVWSQDGASPTGTAIGHPGICEPMADPQCLVVNNKTGISCKLLGF